MRFIGYVCLIIAITPLMALAQEGLGRLDFIGKRANRPVLQENLTHPNGAKAMCFALPSDSCSDDDCRFDRERAQLLQNTPDNREGDAYRYSVSFFLPSNFADVRPSNLILWEVKPRGPGKPSTVIEIIDGALQFSLSNPGKTQKDKMNPERPIVIKRLGGIPRGRWTDIVLDVKWSGGADGVLLVYYDGKLVVDHRGPNIDSNSSRQMAMYGLYRSFISRYQKSTGQSRLPLQEACFANVGRQRIRM